MPDFAAVARQMRSISEGAMYDVTEILRGVETETEPGYPRTTDTIVATTKSRGEALSAREEIVANQAGYKADAKRFLPFGVDVRNTDRLRINGVVYEVLSVASETSSSLQAHVECLCRRTS